MDQREDHAPGDAAHEEEAPEAEVRAAEEAAREPDAGAEAAAPAEDADAAASPAAEPSPGASGDDDASPEPEAGAVASPEASPDASGDDDASPEPEAGAAAEPDASGDDDASPEPEAGAAAEPDASGDDDASPEPEAGAAAEPDASGDDDAPPEPEPEPNANPEPASPGIDPTQDQDPSPQDQDQVEMRALHTGAEATGGHLEETLADLDLGEGDAMEEGAAELAAQLAELTRFDVAISFFQTLGVYLTVDVWPDAFKAVFESLTLPLSLNVGLVGVSSTAEFYIKMALPLLLLWAYRCACASPVRLKRMYVLDLYGTFRVAAYASVVRVAPMAIVAWSALDGAAWAWSATFLLGGLPLILFAGLLPLVILLRVGYPVISSTSGRAELDYLLRVRHLVRQAALFLLLVGYVPLTQAVTEQLLNDDQTAAAWVFGVLYVVGIPAAVLKAATQPQQAQPSRRDEEQEQALVKALDAEKADPITDIIGYAALPVSLVVGLSLNDATRRSALYFMSPLHEADGKLLPTALAAYDAFEQQTFQGTPVQNLRAPFDDGAWFWKAVQLLEKCAIVVVVAVADDSGDDSMVAPFVVALVGLLAVVRFKPYNDAAADESAGPLWAPLRALGYTETVSAEDAMDAITRCVGVVNLAAAALAGGDDPGLALDAFLLVVNAVNLVFVAHSLELGAKLVGLVATARALPAMAREARARLADKSAEETEALRKTLESGDVDAAKDLVLAGRGDVRDPGVLEAAVAAPKNARLLWAMARHGVDFAQTSGLLHAVRDAKCAWWLVRMGCDVHEGDPVARAAERGLAGVVAELVAAGASTDGLRDVELPADAAPLLRFLAEGRGPERAAQAALAMGSSVHMAGGWRLTAEEQAAVLDALLAADELTHVHLCDLPGSLEPASRLAEAHPNATITLGHLRVGAGGAVTVFDEVPGDSAALAEARAVRFAAKSGSAAYPRPHAAVMGEHFKRRLPRLTARVAASPALELLEVSGSMHLLVELRPVLPQLRRLKLTTAGVGGANAEFAMYPVQWMGRVLLRPVMRPLLGLPADRTMAALRSLRGLERMEELVLRSDVGLVTHREVGALVDALRGMPNLRVLELHDFSFTSYSLARLAPVIGGMQRLERLSLTQSVATAWGAKRLAAQLPASLREIDLSTGYIGDSGLRALAAALAAHDQPQPVRIVVHHNGVSDAAREAVKAAHGDRVDVQCWDQICGCFGKGFYFTCLGAFYFSLMFPLLFFVMVALSPLIGLGLLIKRIWFADTPRDDPLLEVWRRRRGPRRRDIESGASSLVGDDDLPSGPVAPSSPSSSKKHRKHKRHHKSGEKSAGAESAGAGSAGAESAGADEKA